MLGIQTLPTDRGGRVTYRRGRAQAVLQASCGSRNVRAYLRTMEAAIVAALAEEGVLARARPTDGPDFTGVWVAERKIASIGVHVSRGVSTHGFAVNVDNDLEPFSSVVTCGLPGVVMTSAQGRELAGQQNGWRPVRGCWSAFASAWPTTSAWPMAAASDSSLLTAWESRRRAPSRAPPGARRGCAGMTTATRSRSNPGGMDVLSVLGPDVRAPARAQTGMVQGGSAGRRAYRELSELIPLGEPAHGLPEAACPNVGECWERGTATFMILGDTCTRRCGFCNVKTGRPTWNDPLGPARVARSIVRMGLRHAVITSVVQRPSPWPTSSIADGSAERAGVDPRGAIGEEIRQIENAAALCHVAGKFSRNHTSFGVSISGERLPPT